ncbi:MAG: hypothetical protein V1792_17490 [Pseudomonadota bacterium]
MTEPRGAFPADSRGANTLPFHEIVEQVANLSAEDQDALIDVIKRRRTEVRRAEIAENIRMSQKEFAEGLAKRGTVDELMAEFGR